MRDFAAGGPRIEQQTRRRRHHHGQPVRLGDHAPRRRNAGGAGHHHDKRIVSAHRTPDRLYDFAKGAKAAGYKVIIAGAGGAAHLPGMTAALTPLPVFGVPVESKALSGQDSLLSIVQMPAGIPVGTLAIGKAGAVNAALLAAAVLALVRHRARQAARCLPRGADLESRRRTDRRAMTAFGPLPPGSTIGIIGGGQLGRMLAMAAARLGYRTVILEPQADCPAAQVANRQIVAAYDDPAALAELAKLCAVVTYEFENVPVAAASGLPQASRCSRRPRRWRSARTGWRKSVPERHRHSHSGFPVRRQ